MESVPAGKFGAPVTSPAGYRIDARKRWLQGAAKAFGSKLRREGVDWHVSTAGRAVEDLLVFLPGRCHLQFRQYTAFVERPEMTGGPGSERAALLEDDWPRGRGMGVPRVTSWGARGTTRRRR